MYEAFYKLGSDPFRLLPDPEICFPHRSCAKAWAYLRYALKRGEGIVVVTGRPGSGKTTLAERLLNELNPAKTVSVRLIANDLDPTDLLRKLAYSFGLAAEGMDRAMLAHRIERYLIELEHSQRQAVVLIDEAQTLSHHSLEAMRLLTDLQSRSRPVLQLFLLGQEGLEDVMRTPGMAQFQQRVIASCRLDRMDLTETKAYMEYRLGFADWQGDPAINGPAVMAIFRFSQGLPRHVNKICSRLLLHGCTEEKHSLKQRDVLAVVKDLRDELLTPMDDEPEVVVDISGTSFGSVDELALVSAPASPTSAKPVSGEEMHALFLAEEQAPPPDAAVPDQTPTETGRAARWRRAGERYSYRVGYPRPYRVRRRVYRLFRIPGVLLSRARELAREWGQVTGGRLLRAGRKAVAGATRAGVLIRGWIFDRRQIAGRLREQMRSVSTGALAGLSALFVIGLALVMWDHDGGPQPSVVEVETKISEHKVLPYLADEVATASPLVLDGPALRYIDVGALPARAGARDAGGLDSSEALPRGEAEPDLLGYRHGMNGEPRQLLLGSVTGNATDQLMGSLAEAAATLDIWSLANEVPDAAGDRPAKRETVAVESSANGAPGSEVPAIAQDLHADDRAENSGAEGVADAEPPQSVVVNDGSDPSPQVVQPADDVIVVAVTEAAVSDQGFSGESAVEQGEVERLLALADWAIEEDRLLRPKKSSAYGYLQDVLAIDPQNEDALSGLDLIVRRYRAMAKVALAKQAFDRAGRYIARGLKVDPANAELLVLRRDLDTAIAELEAAELAEAELARMAVEVTQPAPVVESGKGPDDNFSSLMRLVNGEN